MYTLLLLLSAASAVEPDRSFEEKLEAAQAAYIAEITSMEARWSEGERGGIETVVWAAVEETLKGEFVDSLEVVLPHGRIGEHATGSSAAPDLELDGRYLLLLYRDKTGTWRIFSPTSAVRLRSETAPEAPTADAILAPQEPRHVD